jgi:hypothetical protein
VVVLSVISPVSAGASRTNPPKGGSGPLALLVGERALARTSKSNFSPRILPVSLSHLRGLPLALELHNPSDQDLPEQRRKTDY